MFWKVSNRACLHASKAFTSLSVIISYFHTYFKIFEYLTYVQETEIGAKHTYVEKNPSSYAF